MGFYYKDGSRVGGCHAQLFGAITVIGLVIIAMWASDHGIDFLGNFWTVIKWIVIVVVILLIVVGIYANIMYNRQEKKEQQEREKKEQQDNLRR